MSRSKRSKEEEIEHLRKKLRKLEGQPAETVISITGEYEKPEYEQERSAAIRDSDDADGLHKVLSSAVAEETPIHIKSRSAPRTSHARSESRTNSDAIKAHSSKNEPRASLNVMAARSLRSEQRENLNVFEAHSSRSEPLANLDDIEAHSSRSEPLTDLNIIEGRSSRSEQRQNLNDTEAHSSKSEPRVTRNAKEVHSSRSEPLANLNVAEQISSRSEPRGTINILSCEPQDNLNAMEENRSRSEIRADLNDMNSSGGESQAILNAIEAHSSSNTPFRPQASLEAKDSGRNPGRTRASLETAAANNSKNKKRTSSETSQADVALDRKETLLKALGDDLILCGEVIHDSLAQTWATILRKGLPDDVREKLLKEYAAPENCKVLKAPTLDEEVAAVVDFQARNRDRILENKQNQLGLGITAIGRAITVLLNQGDNYEYNAMKHFNHGCRMLLDLHYTETKSRRHLFKRDLNHSDAFRNLGIHSLERDETLFGSKLTKMVKKQGIRPTPINQRPSSSSFGDPVLLNRSTRNSMDPHQARDGESLRYRRD